jgi:hypothetical protein
LSHPRRCRPWSSVLTADSHPSERLSSREVRDDERTPMLEPGGEYGGEELVDTRGLADMRDHAGRAVTHAPRRMERKVALEAEETTRDT